MTRKYKKYRDRHRQPGGKQAFQRDRDLQRRGEAATANAEVRTPTGPITDKIGEALPFIGGRLNISGPEGKLV